jgi:hypothetical protein
MPHDSPKKDSLFMSHEPLDVAKVSLFSPPELLTLY